MLRILRSVMLSTVVAFGAVGVMNSAAMAQPGQNPPTDAQIAARAVRSIREVAANTCQDMRSIAANAVQHIRRAARNGADDSAIVQIGTRAVQAITNRAAAGTARVEAIKTNALTAIGDDNADATSAVTDAATAASARIETCKTESIARVNAAVDRATGDDMPQP